MGNYLKSVDDEGSLEGVLEVSEAEDDFFAWFFLSGD
jgi:hypothetical protein